MDEKKIAVIIFIKNEEEYLSTVREMQKIQVPSGFEVELLTVTEAEGYADAYQSGMEASDAKYKIYVAAPIKSISEHFYSELFYFSECHPEAGIFGLSGAALPADGDYWQSEKQYGDYYFGGDEKQVVCRNRPAQLYYQDVGTIDPSFFVTVKDLDWDREMGDYFFLAAHCCQMRKNGLKAMLLMQVGPWVAFERDSVWFNITQRTEYERERAVFVRKYVKELCPLVSILIPTYNQPGFFEEALKSALAQDYPNIEIIVGDDSTNEETKKVIQPYLEKYGNIRYYYHGGPLGGKGQKNAAFVFRQAKGEYINYLFHDDIFYPGKIRKMMAYYLSDLNAEIGLVASARDCIDENGKILRRMNRWRPFKDEVMEGRLIGARMLRTSENFLGEMTTVLFRKSALMARCNGQKTPTIQYFCGVLDGCLGDIATWLEICRKGNRCVYISEPLSAFRVHGGQNSNDAEIVINGTIQWWIYFALAWLNDCFLEKWEDYECCARVWGIRTIRYIRSEAYEEKMEARNPKLMWIYRELKKASGAGDFKRVLHLTIEHILSGLENKKLLLRLCQKNKKTGYWEKKDVLQ